MKRSFCRRRSSSLARRTLALFVSLTVITVTGLKAQSLVQYKRQPELKVNKVTTVLILGTVHLSHISKKFSPDMLDSLIAVLAEYHPQIICLEALSGVQIAKLEKLGGIYTSIAKSFAGKPLQYGHIMQNEINIPWHEAKVVSDSLLEQVKQSSQIEERIRLKLIRNLLAAYRLQTAVLQWSYLSKNQRSTQSVVPRKIANGLTELLHFAGERYSISIRLAHRLNLQRVYPIDDFMPHVILKKIRPQISEALSGKEKNIKNAHYFQKVKQLLKKGIKGHNLFPLYQYLNSPAFTKQDKKIQWRGTFLKTNNKFLRTRLALWQTRNLRIAAHIRKASAHDPGGRILVTIGASHKAFLDAYLSQLMGIKLINLDDII